MMMLEHQVMHEMQFQETTRQYMTLIVVARCHGLDENMKQLVFRPSYRV